MSEVSTLNASLPASAINGEPLVSVIIPTYNGSHYLKEAVASVLKQTHTNLECLIVDDGSTDDTRQVSDHLMSQDARVKYFYKQNGDVASARNFGIEHANGEWIQFLDQDDGLNPDKLRFQLSHLNGSEGDNVIFYSDYELVYEYEDDRPAKHKPVPLGSMTKEQLIERFCSLIGIQIACLLLKKTVCLNTKFNEELRCTNDLKFQVDILMNGNNFVYTPISGLFHRRHQSNTSGNADVWPPVMKNDIIRYLNILQEEYQSLQHLCQAGWVTLLKRSLRDADKEMFDKVLKNVQMPVNIDGIKISKKFIIKLLYQLRPYTPSFKTILEYYRSIRKRWHSTPTFLKN